MNMSHTKARRRKVIENVKKRNKELKSIRPECNCREIKFHKKPFMLLACFLQALLDTATLVYCTR